MKVFMLSLAAVIMFTGCAGTLAKVLVPDVDTHLRDTELAHLKAVNADFNNKVVSLANMTTDKKTKLALAKILYKGNKGVIDIKPSAAENLAQQYARMVGREGVEEQIGVGIEWTKSLVTQLAGGSIAGGGMIGMIVGLLRSRSKKVRALNVVNSELDEGAKAKIKKALEHTGMEKEIV